MKACRCGLRTGSGAYFRKVRYLFSTKPLSPLVVARILQADISLQRTLRASPVQSVSQLQRQLTTESGPKGSSSGLEAAPASYTTGLTEEVSKQKHGDTINQVTYLYIRTFSNHTNPLCRTYSLTYSGLLPQSVRRRLTSHALAPKHRAKSHSRP